MVELITADTSLRHAGPPLVHDISGLTADSRQVRPGFLFAALPGQREDGRRFVADAVRRGAVAVLAAPGVDVPAGVALIESDNPRRALSRLAARFYPRQPKTIAAVTGTNGKTSVADFTRQLWTFLGHKAASLGTLGLVSPEGARPGALTTPDPVILHRDLAALAEAGVEHLAMEASSHGLDQFRLDGVRVSAAAFTNLTRDHLDYHANMVAYYAAKRRLFAEVLAPDGVAVLNADTTEFADLAALVAARGGRVIDYGTKAKSLRLVALTTTAEGLLLDLLLDDRPVRAELNLVGAFQAANALAALGMVVGCGAPLPEALAALPRLASVRGRLQRAGSRRNGAPVFVDYAHTPDALKTVLTALRPHAGRRLVVVFGCGGDRDPGKRPIMGQIAVGLADRTIVTDDNPRSEDPAKIRRDILAAAPGAIEIGARRDAIIRAVAELEPGDVLVLAGKGHESGQIIGTTVHPFDDVAVARDAIAAADRSGR
ncbi:MAG TPA: UDP-N-acetylmuramoyl-L-alanyl-D-glutamate--2,6-diaminopimelate ligase [Alphaproteobacteria bacterium]|nr:UDP-N-acetylmuramoyl-L-alanyl-D-glutamate--2,6-diaminopimelate ligase [Alphaproteobacteria bacterium]